MKRLLPATCSALFLIATLPAFAGHGHGHGDHDRGHGHGWVDDDDHGHRDGDHDHDRDRDHDRRHHHDNGLHRGWHKGDRLPVAYLAPRYVVTDYRAYRLPPPRPGYRWVRVPDGRIVLVAIASGVIADILLGH